MVDRPSVLRAPPFCFCVYLVISATPERAFLETLQRRFDDMKIHVMKAKIIGSVWTSEHVNGCDEGYRITFRNDRSEENAQTLASSRTLHIQERGARRIY